MSQVIKAFSGRFALLGPLALSGFFYEGDEYQSVAAAFEAAKIANRADRVSFQAWNCKPWEARKRGKSIPRVWMRPDFQGAEERILLAIHRSKFSWPEPQKVLFATQSAELIYGNISHDNHWGVCQCRDVPPSQRKYGLGRSCSGAGANLVGKTLMRVREELLIAARSRAS
jgi:predicted NAD-dependent protein-ADP-ribosyltransferase YbiA (DUF1768 family)